MNDESLSKEDRGVISSLGGKKILITGAGGMLGKAFVNQINKYIPDPRVLALSRNQLDVCNDDHLKKIEAENPDIIIHSACLVNADMCEIQPDVARNIIVSGTKNISLIAQNCGSQIIYPQSFLIFSGDVLLVDEKTQPSPLNVYGHLKLEAEMEMLKQLPNSMSLRLGGFFGGGEKDKNFVGKFLSLIKKAKQNNQSYLEIGNRVWQPTYTEDIAANALLLLAKKKSGVYCMAAHSSATFYEVAKEILNILGLADQFTLGEIDASLFAKTEAAARPQAVIMQNKRLKRESLDRQRVWSSALKSYLSSYRFTL
jgi:dTDP-4-dehydrorhamnose reductase